MSMQIFIFAALLFPRTTAASCERGACANDETSFVQKVQVVKHGVERAPAKEGDSGWDLSTGIVKGVDMPSGFADLVNGPTPLHDALAIVDSMPAGYDDGRVTEAFHTNKDSIMKEIEDKASSDIAFASAQRQERKTDKEMAHDQLQADAKAIADAKATAKARVDSARAARKEVIEQAKQQVKDAKQEAEALHIKRVQAESAAKLGRKVGVIEGNRAAKNAWQDYKAKIREEEQWKGISRAKARIAAREKAMRAAVEARTTAMQAQDKARIAAAAKASVAAKARSAAAAAQEMTRIEGPEGLKNRITQLKADWAVDAYARQTAEAQKKIYEAASGNFPLGDWPIGP